MSVTLIISVRDSDPIKSELPNDLAVAADRRPIVIAHCRPCDQVHRVVVRANHNYNSHAPLEGPNFLPADTSALHVLQFGERAHAEAWMRLFKNRLEGAEIKLIDPSVALP
jgi:hypothetical protein